MNINPTEFAFYLKNSSLNSEEQQVVLSRLPKLTEKEKITLYERLKKDHLALKSVVQKVHFKRESIQFNLYKNLREA